MSDTTHSPTQLTHEMLAALRDKMSATTIETHNYSKGLIVGGRESYMVGDRSK